MASQRCPTQLPRAVNMREITTMVTVCHMAQLSTNGDTVLGTWAGPTESQEPFQRTFSGQWWERSERDWKSEGIRGV